MEFKEALIEGELLKYAEQKMDHPYLLIIQVPEGIAKDVSRLGKYIHAFSEIKSNKIFVLTPSETYSKAILQKFITWIQEEMSIQKENILDITCKEKLNKTDLLEALVEKQYAIKIDIQYHFQKYKDGIVCAVTTNIPSLEYAFYIVKDGEKKIIQWYDKQNYIKYSKQEDEVLDVVVFVNTPFGKITKKFTSQDVLSKQTQEDISEYFIESNKKKIYIHGSCVTRDILNFGDIEDLVLSGYVARHSVFSVLASPLKGIDVNQIRLKSKFQIRMLYNDCEKDFRRDISAIDAKYVMIDFIDTVRFPLYKYNQSIITGSTEVVESGILGSYPFQRISIFNLSFDEVKQGLEQYFSFLKEHFKEEHIIIHCAYFKYIYRDENDKLRLFPYHEITKSRTYNKILKKYHEIAKELLPQATFIDLCKKSRYIADSTHHFGLSPVHYEAKYYTEVLRIIKML
jgi:hypothetical protein